ncbi:MAG: hypothetical protein QNK82_13100 [Akkermansiaceae bacterium]|jgi:hypothetical protein
MNTIPVIFAQRSPMLADIDTRGSLIPSDWAGQKVPRPVKYLFWTDNTHFHFLAKDENSSGLCHPRSQPKKYQSELWKYDVAEFFLMSADRSRYLEFNLGPNGSWWTSAFTQPRQPAPREPTPIPGVTTSSKQEKDSWKAMASIPLPWLNTNYGFGKETTLNATFILKSPAQIFLTAGDLGPGDPDFHRPDRFSTINAISLA